MTPGYESWGRQPRVRQRAVRLHACPADLREVALPEGSVLPYGNGRSYGDSCLNPAGIVLDTRLLDRYLAFDEHTGVLRCEAGMQLAEIIRALLPRGWFVPVTPGTKYVTVGGCIANDVHGKNHHRAGTFGDHVRCFELVRSDGTRRTCSPTENADWFEATVGGLGLTGLITWVELQLKPVPGPHIYEESIRFPDLAAFFELSAESDALFEYTVAWIDCLARGRALGRGLFLRGDHTLRRATRRVPARKPLALPFTPPVSPLAAPVLRLFNEAYYRRQGSPVVRQVVDFDSFFYPLDGIANWNRAYGPRGLLQYQCVVPPAAGQSAVEAILGQVADARGGSFLGVLKVFGPRTPPGLLTFPREGVTLALDFPYRGRRTEQLLGRLDDIVLQVGGALYPAKDARMPPEVFDASFPDWEAFAPFIDPRFESAFLRRMKGGTK